MFNFLLKYKLNTETIIDSTWRDQWIFTKPKGQPDKEKTTQKNTANTQEAPHVPFMFSLQR